jgi:two-component system, OmpR family, response regulator
LLRRSKSDDERPRGGPARILVVDDDDDCSELLRRVLERATYHVERTTSHDEAVQQVRSTDEPFSAVIIDFKGGGTSSSLKLLDALRHLGNADRAGTPAMILTSTDTNRVFAWQSGTDGFLVRPFHEREFVDEVHSMIERTTDERESYRREMMRAARSAQARRVAE